MTDSTFSGPLEDMPLTSKIRAILSQLEPVLREPREAISLPMECYTSEDWFEFEKRAVWDREWICLGHQGTIPNPGDYFSIEINEDPYLVARAETGEVRVMSAVCQHRGHLLGEACGNTRLFVCPYHAWSYDLTGRLVNAPRMEEYASLDELRAGHCLPVLRSEIWNGFIFINLDGKAPPLVSRLRRVTKELENYHFSDLVGISVEEYTENPWNWKSMHENGLEPYHALYAHKGYHEMAPAELTDFPEWDDDDDGAVYDAIKLAHIDASFNPTEKCLLPVIETLKERDRWRFVICVVPPSVLIATLSDLAFYFLVLPHGANSITLRVGFLFPESTLELPDFEQKYQAILEGFNIINDQDINANTNVHRGKRSRFGNRGRMAPLETSTDHLNRWFVKRYRAYAEELGRKGSATEKVMKDVKTA